MCTETAIGMAVRKCDHVFPDGTRKVQILGDACSIGVDESATNVAVRAFKDTSYYASFGLLVVQCAPRRLLRVHAAR